MKIRTAFIGVLVISAVAALGSCTGMPGSGTDPGTHFPRRVLLGDAWPGTIQWSDQGADPEEFSPRRILLGDAWPGDPGKSAR